METRKKHGKTWSCRASFFCGGEPSPSASPPPVSLRLGHTWGLTTHRVVIQDPRAASLPKGRGSRTHAPTPGLSLRESSREAGERAIFRAAEDVGPYKGLSFSVGAIHAACGISPRYGQNERYLREEQAPPLRGYPQPTATNNRRPPLCKGRWHAAGVTEGLS